MRNLLPRGIVDRVWGIVDGPVSYIESSQHGFHHIIGAIHAAQYTGIREFRVEATDGTQGTAFTIYMFDFPQQQHLDAGRFFFRQLNKLKLNISLHPPGVVHLDHSPPLNAHGHSVGQFVRIPPGSFNSLTLLSNLAILLSESKELREMSFHLAHWLPSATSMYAHIIQRGQSIFPHLGLTTKWPKLRVISLGGIYATEEELVGIMKRHDATLQELEFDHCSLISGFWANIVDEVLQSMSVSSFSLKKVNETKIGDKEFRELPPEEVVHWQYEGTLMFDYAGLPYFVSRTNFDLLTSNGRRMSPTAKRYTQYVKYPGMETESTGLDKALQTINILVACV